MMPTWMDAVLIGAMLAGILALMWAVRRLGRAAGWTPELQRKMVHVATGLSALSFPFVFSGPVPVFLLAAVAIIIMLVLRQGLLARAGIGSVLHDVQRDSFGEIYLVLAIALVFFRSTDTPVLYVLPILIITLSDTASALVGTAYGRKRFTVQDGTKSLEGVVAFFVVTCLCTQSVLILMSDAGPVNIVVLSILLAAFCSLIEADSWRGLDNLFVPVGAHLLLERHLATAPVEMVLIAGIFITIVLAALAFAPAMKMSAQAARAYTILLFLILSATNPVNTILPFTAMIAHITARLATPDKSKNPDLDLVGASTAVALLWLVTGDFFGPNAINLFNLTFAGVAAGFCGLALPRRWWFIGLAVVAALAAVVRWVGQANLAVASDLTPGWTVIVASASLPLLAALIARPAFGTLRASKLFTLSLIVPIGYYITRGLL